jgi:hypothetical protein
LADQRIVAAQSEAVIPAEAIQKSIAEYRLFCREMMETR